MRRLGRALERNRIEIPEVPRRYRRSSDDAPGSKPVIDVFEDALVDYKAKVARVTRDGIAQAVADALGADIHRVVVPHGLDTAWLANLDGKEIITDSPDAPLSAHELDTVDAVVTASRCAVSHTGTIMLDGEADQGRRAISLVPDTHVVIVEASTVFPTVPQAVAVLGEHPTRPTTWIAGPSATSDIELIRVDGVHGPRNLFVIIVED